MSWGVARTGKMRARKTIQGFVESCGSHGLKPIAGGGSSPSEPTRASKIASTWRRYSTMRVKISLQLGLALGLAMPFGQHRRRYLNILPQLFGRIAAQEQPIEKGCFPLGEFEIGADLRCQNWCDSCHNENRSLPKTSAASSRTCVLLLSACQ